MGRAENIEIFEDTQKLYHSEPRLKAAVDGSVRSQSLILGDIAVKSYQGEQVYPNQATVTVSLKRSFEAASKYVGSGLKTCVHNFASAGNPGGGVVRGAGAQEECLCRCSTLYPCLDSAAMWQGFYRPHRALGDPLHNDDCIYTPGVIVFKTDTYMPERMPESDWYTVDVLTCAAPNLREQPSNQYNPSDGNKGVAISQKELQTLHERRLRRILDVAAGYGAEAIILGAFGCGAFRNPPTIVAAAAKSVIREYLTCFKAVEFAVYCRKDDTSNYDVFSRVLSDFR